MSILVNKKIVSLVLTGLLLGQGVLAMTSQNYQINQDSVNFAGLDDGQSANYKLSDTMGELVSGPSDSEVYAFESGYRQTEEELPVFKFRLATALTSSKIAYTAFSSSGKSVTLSNATGYALGDYIAVVENEGQAQQVTVGKIKNVNGLVMTVDFWSGDQGTINANPLGGNDYVYVLSGYDVNLGKLDLINVNVGLSFVELTTTSDTGYTLSITEDHNLEVAANKGLTPVADGVVTGGAGEYGIESIGPDVLRFDDWAITTSNQNFATSSVRSELRRAATVYKASAKLLSPGGHLQHQVIYYATSNF